MKKILGLIILISLAGTSIELHAVRSRSSKYTKTSKHRRYRHVYWNPVLKGSYESMLRQNEEIDRLELPRIQNDDELQNMILRQELVNIEESDELAVAGNLDTAHRYCRPWTREFLDDLSGAFYDEFHKPIQVNSAVRTVDQQKKLRRHNRNAAPIEGETASSHLAGTTVDLAKRGLTRKQKKWLDAYLKNLQDQGLIEAAEERRQACYHIMVKSQYTEWRSTADTVAEDRSATIEQ